MRQPASFRYPNHILATFTLLVSLGCKAPAPLKTLPSTAREAVPHVEPTDIGMVLLLSDPQRFDGKLIRTHGFLSLQFENAALYLHEEDYRHALTKNSFALRLDKAKVEQLKSLNLGYVVIEGVINANGLESQDRWAGAVGKITRLELWPFDSGPLAH